MRTLIVVLPLLALAGCSSPTALGLKVNVPVLGTLEFQSDPIKDVKGVVESAATGVGIATSQGQ